MNECVTVNQEARKSAAIREDGAPKLLTMGSTRVRVGGFNQGVIVGVLAAVKPAYAWVVCKKALLLQWRHRSTRVRVGGLSHNTYLR